MIDLRKYWNEYPLAFVMVCALIVRMCAAFFAGGYLMSDDHFVIVEAASSWSDGHDFNRWLPWTPGNQGPQWTSLFYIGIMWMLFEGMQAVGLDHPGDQMLVIRIIHGLFSLLVVLYGYKIAKRFSDVKTARTVGMLLALFAFLPNLSVKQLQEMVSIPPLMIGLWWLVKDETPVSLRNALIGGFIAGFAVGVRFQAGLVPLGAGLALLAQKNWKAFLGFGGASLASFAISQGQDLYLWGRPFAHLQAYLEYNSNPENIRSYIVLPWYNYIFTLLGFLIPPASLMLLFGFYRESKRALLIVVPVTLFIVFHSFYPNKQERFLLPVLPLIITIGTVGWYRFVRGSRFWQKARVLHISLWTLFWVINASALLVFTFSASKKQKIDAMTWLYEQGDSRTFIQEFTHRSGAPQPPQHYTDNWRSYYPWDEGIDLQIQWDRLMERDSLQRPNYIVFCYKENLEARVHALDSVTGGLVYRKTFDPGFMDVILNRLNPKYNSAERLYIYEVRHPDGVWKEEKWFER